MSIDDSDRRIRVCLWAPLPPPDGGISRWTVRYRRAASSYRLDVTIVDTASKAEHFSERSRFSVARSLNAIRLLHQLWMVLRRDRPDVCHVTTTLFWATPRDGLAVWLCRVHGVPTVLNIRASSQIVAWRDQIGILRRVLLDTVLRSAGVVVVLSGEMKTYLERAIPEQVVTLIPNMVAETEISGPARAANRILPARRKAYRILFVGFRTPLKGLGDLADALLNIHDCELVVAGSPGGAMNPQQASAMEHSLQRLRETGRLIETGALEPEAITCLYREADIFVLPSHREGLPNVLLEAMAAGLPCVATPVGAIGDVLQGNCGLIVPVGDPEQLRNAILALIADPSLRASLSENARRRIREAYSVEIVMTAYQGLYSRLRQSGGKIPRR